MTDVSQKPVSEGAGRPGTAASGAVKPAPGPSRNPYLDTLSGMALLALGAPGVIEWRRRRDEERDGEGAKQ
ncbi:MAG: hypothetical protein WCL44_03635 [bacterium]